MYVGSYTLYKATPFIGYLRFIQHPLTDIYFMKLPNISYKNVTDYNFFTNAQLC